MNREQLEQYITETYRSKNDFPWKQFQSYQVFRHIENQKWFAVIMDLSRDLLGLEGKEKICIVNLKCDPILIGTLRMKEGFYPAYHMRKDKWISVALNDSVSDDEIKMLVDMSYEATAKKIKKTKKN